MSGGTGSPTIVVNIEGSLLTDRDLEWHLRDMLNRGLLRDLSKPAVTNRQAYDAYTGGR